MQPETKVKAKKMLANFTTKIGYPDKWKDYSKLEIRADDLFGDALRSNQFAHDDNIGRLGGPIRRWEWSMTPMTVNAYANFGMNERSEEHTSELQSLMRISYAVFCLKKQKKPSASCIPIHTLQ